MQRLDQVIETADIEESLLLPCERRIGKVFCRGRRAHGDGNFLAVRHLLPGRADFLREPRRQFGLGNPFADVLPGLVQGVDIVHIQGFERRVNSLVESVRPEEIPVSCRCRCESSGDPHAQSGKIADHFTQRGILAANPFNFIHSKLIQLDYVRFQTRLPCVNAAEMDNRP